MKVPNDEEIANHIVPESYAAYREVRREALTSEARYRRLPVCACDPQNPQGGGHQGLLGDVAQNTLDSATGHDQHEPP